MTKKNRFKFPFAKKQECKHDEVKAPETAAAVMVKLTCPTCGAVGYWNWSMAQFVGDGSVDVNVVRTSESARSVGEHDKVQRMMPRVDGEGETDE